VLSILSTIELQPIPHLHFVLLQYKQTINWGRYL
jgi:hypothetical protein